MKKELKLSKYENYPLKDEVKGHHPHYVLHPVKVKKRSFKKVGKSEYIFGWMAAEVLLPKGYIDPSKNPAKVFFTSEKECQKACDQHNRFHGWTKEQADEIISLSMDNSQKKVKA